VPSNGFRVRESGNVDVSGKSRGINIQPITAGTNVECPNFQRTQKDKKCKSQHTASNE
jgi:hypothetical protein